MTLPGSEQHDSSGGKSTPVKFRVERREDGTYIVPLGEYHHPSPDHMLCRYCGWPQEYAAEPPWNRVTLGDGRSALLLPAPVSLNRIEETPGVYTCWHTDATPCDRPNHETVETYYVRILDGDDDGS